MADAQNLDGKTPVKVVPFDAHEQATRGEHVPTTTDSPDKTDVVEYPKAVDHVANPYAEGHLEPVVVNNAAEEEAYLAGKAKDAAAAPAEEAPVKQS
jgi:hypothetical protein